MRAVVAEIHGAAFVRGDLEAHIGRFIEHYNHQRYHESLNNLTPADVYCGRGQAILNSRERIKRDTIQSRRLQHHLELHPGNMTLLQIETFYKKE